MQRSGLRRTPSLRSRRQQGAGVLCRARETWHDQPQTTKEKQAVRTPRWLPQAAELRGRWQQEARILRGTRGCRDGERAHQVRFAGLHQIPLLRRARQRKEGVLLAALNGRHDQPLQREEVRSPGVFHASDVWSPGQQDRRVLRQARETRRSQRPV